MHGFDPCELVCLSSARFLERGGPTLEEGGCKVGGMGRRTLGNQSYSPTYDGHFPLLTAAFSIFATTSIHYHESKDQPCDLGGIRQLLVSNQTGFAISVAFVS